MTADSSADGPRKRIHVARVPMRWRDMDINRRVNNTVYFRYFEQARIEWCDTLRATRGESAALSFVIAAAHCNYRKPLVHPGTVEVIVYAGALGRSSFTLHYDLYMEGDRSAKHADGYTRQVWIDRASGECGRTAGLHSRAADLIGFRALQRTRPLQPITSVKDKKALRLRIVSAV